MVWYLEDGFDGAPAGVPPHVDHHGEAELPHLLAERTPLADISTLPPPHYSHYSLKTYFTSNLSFDIIFRTYLVTLYPKYLLSILHPSIQYSASPTLAASSICRPVTSTTTKSSAAGRQKQAKTGRFGLELEETIPLGGK